MSDHDPAELFNLGFALQQRFVRSGDVEHLEAAIAVYRHAVAVTPPGHHLWATVRSNLGAALEARFKYSADVADVEDAVSAFRDALSGTREEDPARAGFLTNLAVGLSRRYEHSGDPSHLREAVAGYRHAVTGTPPDHPHMMTNATYLADLGAALQTHVERGGDQAALEEAIAAHRDAVMRIPSDHPTRATLLFTLGRALYTWAQRTADMVALEQAIAAYRDGLVSAPPGHSHRASLTSHLGHALARRYKLSGDVAALEEAITAYHHAVAADPGRGRLLSDLGRALRERFERSGDVTALEKAIATCRDAIAATPRDDPSWAERFSELAVALNIWFERTGDAAVLDEAIATHRDVVTATPLDHPDRAGFLSNLGGALQELFQRTGNVSPLEEAIAVHRDAVATMSDEDPERAGYLSNLGLALQKRFNRSGDTAALDEAVATHRDAVGATPFDHPKRAGMLSNLGGALWARFERKRDAVALEEAVAVLREAVGATPPDHPDRAMRLSNLGVALQQQIGRAENEAALAEAVTVLREAIAATPLDHPDAWMCMVNLGSTLRIHAKHAGGVAAQTEAVEVFAQVARLPVASTSVRCRAAQEWADLAASADDWSGAAEGYALAVNLLARLVSPGLPRAEQEDQLFKSAGLVSDAAACALQRDGDAAAALALLEQGRGMLLAQTLDARADLSDLRDHSPQLATRFEDLRTQLDETPSTSSTSVTAGGDGVALDTMHEYMSDRRHQMVQEWEELIERIRSIPGFDRFLLPPQLDQLTAAAAHGPIVTVNVNRYRSDALILTLSGVQAVPLPGLTPESEREHAATFLTALDLDLEDQWAIPEVLSWLWEVLAEPVLKALGITGAPPPDRPLPRVWWIPTGLLSLLPLHAAGRHADHSGETVMDRVVSSYTPTIRVLQHTRATQPAVTATPARPLIVAMAQTPGQPDLPEAGAEANLLAERLPEAQVFTGDHATRDNVLAALSSSDWAHFACHAASDIVRPSLGCLLLHDGPLSVLDIARLRVPNAALAYLSACSTAGASVRLADEAIHISSAFQLAGYAHVIATLWPILDEIGLDIADDIYASLTAASPQISPAHAVLAAARRQRDANDGHYPALWASHIHTGP
jgi:tetratricopeptide (TPR) repeat protein